MEKQIYMLNRSKKNEKKRNRFLKKIDDEQIRHQMTSYRIDVIGVTADNHRMALCVKMSCKCSERGKYLY